MAFGVKTKNIKTQNSYTIESFFDAIKDKEFTAGTPSLTKHGMATVITFPALDSQNQVWIMKSGFGKETQKFSIQKSTQAGMDNVAKNALVIINLCVKLSFVDIVFMHISALFYLIVQKNRY